METLHEALEEAAEILQSAQSQPSSTELSVAAKDIPRADAAAPSYFARQGKRQRTQTLQLGDFSDVDDTYWQQDQHPNHCCCGNCLIVFRAWIEEQGAVATNLEDGAALEAEGDAECAKDVAK